MSGLITRRDIITVGSGTFYDPAALCAIGNFPPISLGEDRAVGEALEDFRENARPPKKNVYENRQRLHNITTLSHVPIEIDHTKKYFADLQKIDYYEVWTQRVNQEIPTLPETEVFDRYRISSFLIRSLEVSIENLGGWEERLYQVYAFCLLFLHLYEVMLDPTFSNHDVRQRCEDYSKHIFHFMAQPKDMVETLRKVGKIIKKEKIGFTVLEGMLGEDGIYGRYLSADSADEIAEQIFSLVKTMDKYVLKWNKRK